MRFQSNVVLYMLVLGLGLTACRSSTDPNDGDRQPPTTDSVLVTVEPPVSAQLGESVPIRMAARNTAAAPISLELIHPPNTFDIRVLNGLGELVWSRRPEVVPLAGTLVELQPGEELEFLETWDQTNNEGVPVEPGQYMVVGVLGINRESEAIPLTIVE